MCTWRLVTDACMYSCQSDTYDGHVYVDMHMETCYSGQTDLQRTGCCSAAMEVAYRQQVSKDLHSVLLSTSIHWATILHTNAHFYRGTFYPSYCISVNCFPY